MIRYRTRRLGTGPHTRYRYSRTVDPLRRTSPKQLLALARDLRLNPTPGERHAWALLRNRQVLGLKFRRQHILHGFIVDFCCLELRLVLELDGAHHHMIERARYDAARTALLRTAGYRVLRIRNRDITRPYLVQLVQPLVRPLRPGTHHVLPKGVL